MSDLLVLGCAAVAGGICGKGWFVDRWEDHNDKYELEEKTRIWRVRAWRHSLSPEQRLRYTEYLGPDLRVIRPRSYDRDFEAALFGHAEAERVIHEREMIWAQAGNRSRWQQVTALFISESSLDGYVVISIGLAAHLGLTEEDGSVRVGLRPASRSSASQTSCTSLSVEKFTFSIAGEQFTFPALVRDLRQLGGAGSVFLGLPRGVQLQLQQRGLSYSTFAEHLNRRRRCEA